MGDMELTDELRKYMDAMYERDWKWLLMNEMDKIEKNGG